MNEQLPPVDSDLREHLARRSAGRLPEALVVEVFSALDSAPVRRSIWRVPRLAVAGMSLGLVAILVVAIAFSAVRTRPAASAPSLAGYPAERALTTAELASLMAGPALPLNTALVASVTIEVRNDVCPMNRYPTVGVLEGIGSQVCVVGDATLAAQTSNTTMSGTYAFRYLAPGVLGLLGQITPASSRLAFKVTDEWPLPSAIFLVQGWLGADKLAESCFLWPASDDVLGPAGNNCPFEDWLGDEATAPGISNDYVSHQGSPSPSYNLLSLRGNARHVGAGGMRTIDSIDSQTPVRGTFVVRGANGPCPGAAPQENRGCTTWRVLAKLADITFPAPTQTEPTPTVPTPTVPTPTAPTGYPVDRALTTAELAAVMAGPALAVNTTLIATVTIDSSEAGTPGCPMNNRPTIGAVRGMRTLVCVFGGGPTPARIPGIFAFRYLGPGTLDLLGQITPASSSRPVFGATGWPWSLNGWDTFLVGGYLIREPTGWRIADTLNGPAPSASTFLTVQVDAAAGIDSMDPSQYGVFVVIAETVSVPASSMGPEGDGIAFHVVAKVADISVPGAAGSPSPSPRESPAGPPATPLAPALTGAIGTSNRPLTVDELETLMVEQPDHLAGRIVIVEAPIPTQISCQSDANGGGCAVNTKPLAQTGIWAVSIGTEGALRLVGQITTPMAGGYVFTLDAVNASASLKAGDLVIVGGWLLEHVPTCDYFATPLPSACGPFSTIASMATDNSPASLGVQQGAYQRNTGTTGDWTVDGPPVHGLFLVQLNSSNAGTLLCRLEPAVLP
ncbi:MAG TPA: hypothetical protein VF344_08585 [Candidatus Limnocylindrales bacterium]